MQNGPSKQTRPGRPFAARPKRWAPTPARPVQNGSLNARAAYERYLALAKEEARSGNVVGAENYYQHAEHYFRLMSSYQRVS
jgi:Domain of unknown function (DUF4167)